MIMPIRSKQRHNKLVDALGFYSASQQVPRLSVCLQSSQSGGNAPQQSAVPPVSGWAGSADLYGDTFVGVPILRTLTYWGLYQGTPILGTIISSPYEGSTLVMCSTFARGGQVHNESTS